MMSTGTTPGNVFARPAPFEGPGNIALWIRRMRNYVCATRSGTVLKYSDLAQAILLNLDKSAATWADTQLDSKTGLWKTDVAATSFLEALEKQYMTYQDKHYAEQELGQLKQTTTVRVYLDSFLELSSRVGDMEDSEMRHRFIAGLKPNIRKEVNKAEPDQFEKAHNLALKCDDDHAGYTMVTSGNQQQKAATGNQHQESMDMDVDSFQHNRGRLPTHEKMRYMREGMCFICQQKGHIANMCPQNRNRSRNMPPQRFYRQPQINSFNMFEQMQQFYAFTKYQKQQQQQNQYNSRLHSGCTGMVINEKLADALTDVRFTAPLQPMNASVADQRLVPITRIALKVAVAVGPTLGYYDLIVAPVRYDAIVGVPWMAANNASVDWDTRLLQTHFGAIPELASSTLSYGRAGPQAPALAHIDVSLQMNPLEKAVIIAELSYMPKISEIVEVDNDKLNPAPEHPIAAQL
ncbi:hypothetical protein GGI05_000715 [Coemansia sp. RSA 2603]|nr:hypothetical protein GGI05_000715 [Coemansia sp. RSA 2603]